MKITLLSDDRIRLEGRAGPMTIEADSADKQYSPYHMLASGLATCTYAVLQSWATNARIPADDLALEVGWSFVEDPHRVGRMELDIDWPSLPAERRAAAQRVAALCTVKKTFENPPEIVTEVKGV
ncbi:MAG TPA: OsmC family protein [Longimicrobiaceae bacterium]|nr:OsmC family protein [Longimicrobiaceae bacterium]